MQGRDLSEEVAVVLFNAAFGGAGLFVIPGYTPALRDYCATYGATSNCATTNGVLNSAIAFPVLFRPALLGGNPLYPGRGSATSPRVSNEYMASVDLDYALTDKLNLTSSVTYSEYVRSFGGTDTFGECYKTLWRGLVGQTALMLLLPRGWG